MKIRIKGNSVRLRLTKSEVKCISEDIPVSEKVDFGSTQLYYQIDSIDIDQPVAKFENNMISITLPKSFTANWVNNEVVGIEHLQKNINGSELILLIEKDFVCLDRTFEDQSDNYEHPKNIC
jgi:hypothetical protein